MVIQGNYRLFTNMDAAGESKIIPNAQGDVCALTISGDFTEAEVVFEGRSDASTQFFPLGGFNTADFSRETGSYTKAGIYEIDVVGMRQVRVRIISVSGGTITVVAQLISTSEV